MAYLRALNGAGGCVLLPEHLIGRGPQCALRLVRNSVSAQHALIRWNGNAWELLDRGSRNGTRLDGKLLEPGRPELLAPGATIGFGDPDELWTVSDVAPPQVMVVELDSEAHSLGVDGVIGLPSPEDPVCTIYRDADGLWKLEPPDDVAMVISDGQIFEAAGKRFRFHCPTSAGATATAEGSIDARRSELFFGVSSDEEFVTLELRYPDRTVALGARSQNYLLLTLARARHADRAAGLADNACGWVYKEQLADDMLMTPAQVDGEVFRIRKHFATLALEEAATVIERRPRTRQLRLGLSAFNIQRI